MEAKPMNEIDDINRNPGFLTPPVTVKRTVTSTGARITTQIKADDSEDSEEAKPLIGWEPKSQVNVLINEDQPKEPEVVRVKEEPDGVDDKRFVRENVRSDCPDGLVEDEVNASTRMSFDEFLKVTNTKVMSEECLRTQINEEQLKEPEVVRVKQEPNGVEDKSLVRENVRSDCPGGLVKYDVNALKRMSFEEFLKATDTKVRSEEELLTTPVNVERPKEPEAIKVKEEPDVGFEGNRPSVPKKWVSGMSSQEGLLLARCTKSDGESAISQEKKLEPKDSVKAESPNGSGPNVRVKEEPALGAENKVCVKEQSAGPNFSSKPHNMKKEIDEDRRMSSGLVEDGDFPEEPDWFLVGRTIVTALSTTRGRKLVDNEIVDFTFPSQHWRHGAQWIVRFSTKRFGEIGRLPMEWAKCVIPLVNGSKVKVLGRCVAAPSNLSLMQEIMLYVSFYIHRSIFTEGDKSSWRLDASYNIDSTLYPLLTLFELLKIKPYQKAEFTPEDLHSRKRVLNLEGDSEEAASALPILKRRKGCQQYPEQSNDEQVVTESSLNKLVGAIEVYNLEEMEPPYTLMCDLRPYQKQALYWMSELEKGIDVEKAAKTLHPCWAAYRICDRRASSIYVNNFSGEATTKFPTATQMARGGILADAMGLGKTVMTIGLILARPGRGCPAYQEYGTKIADTTEITKKTKKDCHMNTSSKANGGTLIVCPMALLGQWKDELETHSKPESISIFVHYGGGRANDPKVMAEYDVVLTTYGVLSAAYKNDAENSIFHRVSWYRVVLDEAHTIKSWKTQGAQAAFTLSSHCRWCLTGTPLQNNLEDLYSLLCFLHVEPWCNWAWWNN
ncbi:hypothetical protein SLA2020_448300 [Shorea laevis]